ncbi:MAG: hypothetical protein WC393_01365 [Candidatus Nanoarchaeia archaeon]|jgi:ABC-type antimicrobial peptide transport system permease subunit
MNSKITPSLIIALLVTLAILGQILDSNIVIELGIISFFIIFYYFVIRKEIKEDMVKLVNKFESIEKRFEKIEKKFEIFENKLESVLKKK